MFVQSILESIGPCKQEIYRPQSDSEVITSALMGTIIFALFPLKHSSCHFHLPTFVNLCVAVVKS